MADSGDEEEEYEEREDVRDNEAGRVVDEDEEDEEEEEEEGQDEYEKDGFIVDEEDEEEEPDELTSDEKAKARKKKRKKRGEETYELDDDDYELLQEANVTGFHRPPKADNKKKFKRLKKAGRIGGEKGSGTLGLSDEEEEEEGGSRRGRTAEEELKRSLFGDDEGAAPEEVADDDDMEEEDEEEMGEEDEMADFIVDEEEVDEHGEPSRRKKKVKKKGFRQAPGINSIALQEAQEIFGDVTSLLEERRKRERDTAAGLDDEEREEDDEDDEYGRRRAPPQKLLEKQFEPSLLEEKFLTERDDRLRETDVPERLQLLEESAGALPSSDLAIKQAAEWIFERAFGHLALPPRPEFGHLTTMDKSVVVGQVADVLHLIHDEKLEVPYIGMYRRDRCIDLLKEPVDEFGNYHRPMIHHYEALWAVQQWDKKWLLLQRRKAALQAAYEKRIPADVRDDSDKDDLAQKLFRALADAQSEQAIDDCDAKFNLHFPPDEVEIVEGGFKRPKRRSLYSVCRKAGLGSVAKHFGLAPDLFGENLQATYKRHDVEDESYSPDDLATRFCAADRAANEFRDPASVLRGARHMMAIEISTEPAVREYVRTFYTERAVVSTRPTQEGNEAIDSFHQYAGVKWLVEKPVGAFDDAQWLLIQKAEEEKLLEVTVGLPKKNSNLLAECEELYLSDGVSLTAQQWNDQRRQILRDALVSVLLPSMEKEARMIMAARAKQWLAAKCGLQLWNKVSVAPFVPQKPTNTDDRNDDAPAPRVLACCWGPGNPATTFVMLDSAGEVMNILYTGYLTIRALSPEQIQRKQNDQARLLQFMRDYQPHVVVLGAANLNCRHLHHTIFEVIFKVVEQHPRDLAEGLDMFRVVYGDESIPSLYENSHISQEQLPGQPGIVRRAVALGRFLQNPVAMIASLCGPTKEVLSLKLHPLQSCLTSEEIYEAIERLMVTVTNQVGIDINLAASHDWIFAPLQFIAGLGPRKAGAIQRAIQSAGRVGTRKDLYANLRVMDKKVFINSAGFIRVRGSGQAASGIQHLDPLDDTRIHPESYQVAKDMAEAAFKEEAQQNDDEVDEDLLEMAVEHVMTNPNVLDTMDINEYAHDIQGRDPGKGIQTLELIKSELQHGFWDWRNPYTEPNEDECFYMLSGETEETLSVGRIVQATVRKVQQNRVICVLESGLLGFIQKEDLSDDRDVEPSDKVAEGNIVTCRVKDVKKTKYLVDLTCKGSDLRGDYWGNQRRDEYYIQDDTYLRNEQEKVRRKKEEDKKKAFKPRMIVHPQFQNVSVDEAIKALVDKDVGDFIIRPSSKGPTHLSMTLKIFDGVYTHIDIAEGGKESRDLTSFLSLGKTLSIGEESYEDLDEVIARYVDPLVTYLREMFRYRKYRQGSKSDIDEALRSDRAENPKRIPYYFSLAHEHPGAFMLSYIRAVTPHHEYISLSPKGFRFRKKNFESIDKLVAYFQKHFNDPIPEAPVPLRRALGAMVPSRSPSSYSAGSYGYSAGSRKPSDSGGSGYDSRNGWNSRGGNSRSSSGGGGWGRGGGNLGWGGRGSESSDWDKGGGRSGWDNGGSNSAGGGSSGWDTEPSSRDGWGKTSGAWDNAQSGGSSRGAVWEKGTGASNSGGGGWDSVAGGGGGSWGDKGGTTSNTTGGISTWDSAGGINSGGWDTVQASGGWNNAPAGGRSGEKGGGYNQGRGSRDRGDWVQASGQQGEKGNSNGWGSGPRPASPSRKPAQSGWKEGGGTPARSGGGGGGEWVSSTPSRMNSAGTSGHAAPAGDNNWGSVGAETSSGPDWGAALEPAAPGSEATPEESTGGWGTNKSAEGASGWRDDKIAGKSSGWADERAKTSTGWGDENRAKKSSSWGDGNTEKISEGGSSWRDNNSEKTSKGGSGWGDGNSEKPSKGGSRWGDGNSEKTSKVGSGWGGDGDVPGSSNDGWNQPSGKGPDVAAVSTEGSAGWNEGADKEPANDDGPDWGAVSPVRTSWASARGGRNDQEAAPDGDWNSRSSQGGWGGQGQDRERGRGEGRGGRGPHHGGGRYDGWDRQQPVPPGTKT